MGRRIPSEKNYSIYGQHLSQAVQAVLMAPEGAHLYGYATITGTREHPEVQVHTFPDQESMTRALSSTFNGRLVGDLYPDVYQFAPDKPLNLKMVIEWDDEDEDDLDGDLVDEQVVR